MTTCAFQQGSWYMIVYGAGTLCHVIAQCCNAGWRQFVAEDGIMTWESTTLYEFHFACFFIFHLLVEQLQSYPYKILLSLKSAGVGNWKSDVCVKLIIFHRVDVHSQLPFFLGRVIVAASGSKLASARRHHSENAAGNMASVKCPPACRLALSPLCWDDILSAITTDDTTLKNRFGILYYLLL